MRQTWPMLRLAAGAWLVGCAAARPAAVPSQTTVQTEPPRAMAPVAAQLSEQQEEEILAAMLCAPREQQQQQWRQWARSEQSARLRELALAQLAWAKDPSAVSLALQALRDPGSGMQAQAARVLAHVGLPHAASARSPLFTGLKHATQRARRELVWALVVLQEPRVVRRAIQLYQDRRLLRVKRLDGGPAFDLQQLARLSRGQAGRLVRAPRPTLRRLAAASLAVDADPAHTAALARLARDPSVSVASEACVGLAKIGTARARAALVEALESASQHRFAEVLRALRDAAGTQGLLSAADAVSRDRERGWYQTRAIFDFIEGPRDESRRGLNDPRGGDALLAFIRTRPHIHWETRAAFALARIGELRAVPILARRLRMDPLKIYSDQYDWEMLLKRDDRERVVAARLIAQLAKLHPDSRRQIREQAEDAIRYWITEMPSPHANGMRALAAMQSNKYIGLLRSWAKPDAPLPKEGQQPPLPEEWVIAQSALRYVGMMKDPPSWTVLTDALRARPEGIDVTMDSLLQGGLAILGMTLRALGVGAAQGLASWRDPRAFEPLLDYVQSPYENEQARMEACRALGWVATPDDRRVLLRKIREYDQPENTHQFVRACLLEAFLARPESTANLTLLELLHVDVPVNTRPQAARAIGRAGVDEQVASRLLAAIPQETFAAEAALALILGADPATAVHAVALLSAKVPGAIELVSDLYYRSFGYWSHEDLEQGRIFRWVDNALAISRAPLPHRAAKFARAALEAQLRNLLFDNGPHTLMRAFFRYRLLEMARGHDPRIRLQAVRTLLLAREQGALLALRDLVRGEHTDFASEVRRAYHELLYPSTPPANFQPEDDLGWHHY